MNNIRSCTIYITQPFYLPKLTVKNSAFLQVYLLSKQFLQHNPNQMYIVKCWRRKILEENTESVV